MTINDAHVHFFSQGFFRALASSGSLSAADPPRELAAKLGWEPPPDPEALADRWVAELDRHGVGRAMIIASMPGDDPSVRAAVARHPSRLVGAFMVNPGLPGAADQVRDALTAGRLTTACLFPAMHRVPLDAPESRAVFEAAADCSGAVFVHCGVLSIGVRKRLGLPSAFDLRLGDPLAVAALAGRYPGVPVIIPHFGAGLFREALMAAGAAPNIFLDTSSSNSWTKLYPGLSLRDVFARALDVLGASRLLFGTDSSFFPRGWQRVVYEEQQAVLTDLGLGVEEQAAVFGSTFDRLFPRAEAQAARASEPAKL